MNVVVTCTLCQTFLPAISIRKKVEKKRNSSQTNNHRLTVSRPNFTHPGLRPVLHLHVHQLHPLQCPFFNSSSLYWQKSPNVPSTLCAFSHTGCRPTFLLPRRYATGLTKKSFSIHADDTSDVTIIQFKLIYDLEISTDISIVQPKSDIHTWIYPWIYLWISISTATLGLGGGWSHQWLCCAAVCLQCVHRSMKCFVEFRIVLNLLNMELSRHFFL